VHVHLQERVPLQVVQHLREGVPGDALVLVNAVDYPGQGVSDVDARGAAGGAFATGGGCASSFSSLGYSLGSTSQTITL
jgi:hypothetical protein